MRFAFMRNGFQFPIHAAWSDVITVANVNEPLQGHLALTALNRLAYTLPIQFHTAAQRRYWCLQAVACFPACPPPPSLHAPPHPQQTPPAGTVDPHAPCPLHAPRLVFFILTIHVTSCSVICIMPLHVDLYSELTLLNHPTNSAAKQGCHSSSHAQTRIPVCSEMLIQWTTKNSSAPQVQWGLTSSNCTASAAAKSITYGRGDLCGGPAVAEGWMDPGLLHQAVMTGLIPGQHYYYVYGDKVCVALCCTRLS